MSVQKLLFFVYYGKKRLHLWVKSEFGSIATAKSISYFKKLQFKSLHMVTAAIFPHPPSFHRPCDALKPISRLESTRTYPCTTWDNVTEETFLLSAGKRLPTPVRASDSIPNIHQLPRVTVSPLNHITSPTSPAYLLQFASSKKIQEVNVFRMLFLFSCYSVCGTSSSIVEVIGFLVLLEYLIFNNTLIFLNVLSWKKCFHLLCVQLHTHQCLYVLQSSH